MEMIDGHQMVISLMAINFIVLIISTVLSKTLSATPSPAQ